ncbi:MAG: hypothetical protein ACR2MQ_06470, partial [Gemmatimonadaceae bacterium]
MSRLLLSVVLPAVRAHRWIVAAATVVLAALAVGVPHEARAQDSCSSGNFEVMPCVLGETHVNSGGTAQFEIYNYYYGDDYYYVTPSCSGIVYGCSSGLYYQVPAYSSGNVSINFRVSSYGVGYVDADIVSDYGGGDVNVEETVYGQAMLAIDSAQTILSTADQPMGRCAAACFTAGTSISTVPFYTLGQARNVTLVYNEDRAHPRPFIYAIVSPAADGPTVSSYSMTATLNGTAVQFSNGDYTLNFTSPGSVPVRLGGQISLSPGIPDIYDLVVSVVAQYSNAGSGSASYTTKLVVYDAGGSFVARGWSIANINKLDCDWYPNWRGCIIYGGDGSVEHYQGSFPSYQSADHATLTFNYGNNHYERKFPDGSIDQYDGGGYMTASIDPYGRATTFGYNGAGRLTQIVDPRHNAGASVPYIQLGYDSNGRLHTITETGGPGPSRTTTVWVDGNLNLWAVTDPDGQSSYVSYDGSNRLSATTDRRGGATYYGYDWAGKLASVVAPSVPVNAGGGSTTMQSPTTYYSAWQTVGVPSSSTAGTPFYAQAARDITGSVNAPGGRTTSFGVNDWGEATVVFDPAGQMTYASYDARVPKRIRRPDGSLTAASYDALDRLTMSQTAGQAAAYYYYNSVSQVDSVRGANVVSTNYHYNPDNTLASVGNAAGVSVSYSYNGSKEVTSATDNGGHTTSYGYDNLFGNQDTVTAPGNRTMTSTMDVYGRVSTVSAPLRATVTTTYDVLNRPYQVTEAGRPATTFGYDALFNTSVTDARGNVTTMAFDALGRASSRTDPNNATESFRYDIAGRKTSWTNRRGQMMTYGYDADDRLTSRTGSGIADNYSYATVENMTIAVTQNSVEVDSLFSTTAVGGTTSDLDSVVTHVNGARYQVLHSHPGSLSAPYTMSVATTSGVSIRTRSTALSGTTGLVNSISDGFNIAYPGYNGEALPNSLYNPVSGTNSATYMSLHAPSETSFSDGTLESTFGRSNHYDALGRVDMLNSLGAGTQHAYYYDQYGELTDDRISAGCYGSVVTPDEGANYANCT